MTMQGEHEQRLERLRAVVAAYGGDAARWPVEDQNALGVFADTEPAAQAIVREARAFDQLLNEADLAADHDQQRNSRLADKIFEAITVADDQVVEQPQRQSDNVIDFASRRRGASVSEARDDEIASTAGWMSVAALAASLVIGVMLGANGYLEPATTGLGEIAGLNLSADNIQFEDGLGPLEEDYL